MDSLREFCYAGERIEHNKHVCDGYKTTRTHLLYPDTSHVLLHVNSRLGFFYISSTRKLKTYIGDT